MTERNACEVEPNRTDRSRFRVSASQRARTRSVSRTHLNSWPQGLPFDATVPETNLFHNLEVSAARYPNKAFALFFDGVLTYRRLKDEAQRLAGYLQAV